jgi:ParB family chromosome partitioning protein
MAKTTAKKKAANKATKKATKKKTTKKKTTKRKSRKKAEKASRGLEPAEIAGEELPANVLELAEKIKKDGGATLAQFRDPLGGKWQLLAALPLELVEPTPFQRDLSDSHAKRMTQVIGDLDRFLDPILAVRTEEGKYWTPNGLHRMTAMGNLGAKSIVALVVPEFELVYKILALNTERAHNLKEKALEVIRMARALADITPQPETDFSLEFEEPQFLTLGICYEQRARFAGSAYGPAIKKAERFMDCSIEEGIVKREGWATQLLAIDDRVAEIIKTLKARGFDSPYLKNFVVARINPLRFGSATDVGDALEKMQAKAEKFDNEKIRESDVQRSG